MFLLTTVRKKFDMAGDKVNVLFVCLGNICRSPIAEAVFRQEAKKAGLDVYVDSAGTINYHEGKKPDSRGQKTLNKHGVEWDHRAREITNADFDKFDYIFGKDESNMSDLKGMQPRGSKAKVLLFGDYYSTKGKIIRDPYYDSGDAGFEQCYQECLVCSNGFIKELQG